MAPLFAEEEEDPGEFDAVQAQLAAWIRDPENAPPPKGVERRRLEVYRDLFYNNIEGFVVDAFPRLRSLFSESRWRRLVRSFIAGHTCRSPYFREISREFLVYLEHERAHAGTDPPFLLELAHYEWARQALEFADAEIPEAGVDPEGDLMEETPAVSPLVCSLRYDFAVQRFSAEEKSAPRRETFLFVYRDREERIGVMEGNALSARLLALLAEGGCGREALRRIADETPGVDAEAVFRGGEQTLQKFRSRAIVLGTVRT